MCEEEKMEFEGPSSNNNNKSELRSKELVRVFPSDRVSTPKHDLNTCMTDTPITLSKKLKLNVDTIRASTDSMKLNSPSPSSILNSKKFRSPQHSHRLFGPGAPPRSPTSPHRFPGSILLPKQPPVGQFYFPQGIPVSPNTAAQEESLINRIYVLHQNNDLTEDKFQEITTQVCGFSPFCNRILFQKIDVNNTGHISKDMFCTFWSSNLQNYDQPCRLFRLLQKPVRKHLVRGDFIPLIKDILDSHCGLQFLKTSPEFHDRYVDTVIGRIFYHVNKSGNEKLTEGELKRSNFVETLLRLHTQEDINEVVNYFSYEHFYVIYCKFWELDEDHDFEIDKEALLKYDEHCHIEAVVQRVIDGVPRKLRSGKPGIMNYEDFIPFILSSEDKTNRVSIDYWFKCLDLDGDGVIAPYEIEHFFNQQQVRIKHYSDDAVEFRDFICQLNDMIKPKEEARFSRQDIRNSKLAGLFFDMIFNLSKFALYESRDPIRIEEIRRTPHMSDWDRFAAGEYQFYAVEDSKDTDDDDDESDIDILLEFEPQIDMVDELESSVA